MQRKLELLWRLAELSEIQAKFRHTKSKAGQKIISKLFRDKAAQVRELANKVDIDDLGDILRKADCFLHGGGVMCQELVATITKEKLKDQFQSI